MTKITFTQIDSSTVNTNFKDMLAANFSEQWMGTQCVIKTNRENINESVIIPSDTNGYSAGTVRIGAGHSVTVNGEWRIL